MAALARHTHTKSESNSRQEQKPISCPNCSEVFCTKTQLEVSKLRNFWDELEKKLIVIFCPSQHHMKQHKNDEEQFKCSICGYDLKEKVALDEHTKLHTGLSPLQCVLCNKSFKQKGALVRHMRIHVSTVLLLNFCSYQKDSNVFISQQSGLHFYQCHRCGKGFIHKSSFEMHLLAHDDIRKKSCPHCSQMFRSTSHLNRHLRIHVRLTCRLIVK